MEIKYDYPHAFYLSVGIILFIFGLFPFYVSNFNFSELSLTKLIVNTASFFLSLYFIYRGFSLWKEREENKKEMADATRKRINQTIELQELEIQERRAKNQVILLEREIDILEESKKSKVREQREEIELKRKLIKKLEKDIEEKQVEIHAKTTELFTLKKEEIAKTPSSYMSYCASASGALVYPITASGTAILPSYEKIISSSNPCYTYGTEKECKKCHKKYYGFMTNPLGWCDECMYGGYVKL